jgi:hypothetical protein
MANIYVNGGDGSTTGYYAVPKWTALQAVLSTDNGGRGTYRRQLAAPAIGSERVFRCTVSGTTGAAEPAWVLTKNGVTAADGTATWTECTGQELDQGPVGGIWTAPHARMLNAIAATWSTSNDTYYKGSNDVGDTQAAALSLVLPGTSALPNKVLSVTQTTVPPTSSNIAPGAVIATTGASVVNINGATGVAYWNGITFSIGSGASAASLIVCNNQLVSPYVFDNCKFTMVATTSANSFSFGNAGVKGVKIILNNPTFKFAGASQKITFNAPNFIWRGGSVDAAGSIPTVLLGGAGTSSFILLEGVDLSAMGAGKTIVGEMNAATVTRIKDCLLGSGVTIAAATTAPGQVTYVERSDSGATNYRLEKYDHYLGSELTETTIVRTGGATDLTTPFSRKLSPTANTQWFLPLEGIRIGDWNDTVGSSVTVIIEGLQDPRTSVSLPLNDAIWFDAEYLGSAGNPLGSVASGTKADILATGSALTASTAAWDSLVAARVNSTTYSIGNAIKVASNPGRVFICTAGGAAAGSEPVGYASAVDGGSVTDGAATFKAAVRFNQTLTFTPQMKGYIYVTPKAANPSGIYYFCPALTKVP